MANLARTTIFLIIVCCITSCESSTETSDSSNLDEVENQQIRLPSTFFDQERPKVLIVGTFHFDYPDLDGFIPHDNDKIDVLNDIRQKEVTELVNYIKIFNPTKIAVEANDSWEATVKLRDYQNGKMREVRDERVQIGIRIANELDHDTIYSIDAGNLYLDLIESNPAIIDSLEYGTDSFVADTSILQKYKSWRSYSNSILQSVSLLNYFKYLNSEEYHKYDYGNYLIDYFKLDQQRGADILSIWWYNRNLRIFNKIQKIPCSNNDNLLVIIGNGHAAVLRQLFESSVEYEYVEFNGLSRFE